MTFLINCSNLKAGGGLQVADSICGQLNRYGEFRFVVVLSSFLDNTKERIRDYKNVNLYSYDIPNTFRSIIMGRDSFLNGLIEEHEVEAVLTVFGPSRWKPSVPHLSGFALAQLVIPESPYFKRMRMAERLKWKLWRSIRQWSIKRSADYFWTENPYISERLRKLFRIDEVYTVSNCYNQIFDCPQMWRNSKMIQPFKGTTLLSISSYYPHKNFEIIPDVVRSLKKLYPSFNFRFILTIDEHSLAFDKELSKYVVFLGKIDVSECPMLYMQSDIMFMPSLLECFTATYPEAMRMGVPIVTTNMEFAQGLCGDAACYYSAMDADAAAKAIYKVATEKDYANKLVVNGKEQLKKYDNYEQRASKLIGILEEMVKSGTKR